jgi:acyl-CoA thioesterase-1
MARLIIWCLMLWCPVMGTLNEPSPPILIFLGDSLTAGYQLNMDEAFPSQIETIMGTPNIRTVNRGVSGDTSYTLLNRLAFSLNPTPNAVFLCVGANDGLRGMPLEKTRANVSHIISYLKQKNIPVILAGVTLPDNYTDHYIDEFNAMGPALANQHNIPYLPFLLNDVAGVPSLNLSDRIHPNPAGHRIIAHTVVSFLKSIQWVSLKNQWVHPSIPE